MPRYHVHHLTSYTYSQPVSLARHQLHLSPRPSPRQRVLEHRVVVNPAPAYQRERNDAFGNPLAIMSIETAHRRLCIAAESEIEVLDTGDDLLPGDGAPLTVGRLREANIYRGGAPVDGTPYLFDSPFVRPGTELDSLAGRFLQGEVPVLTAIDALVAAIHAEYRYAPGVTDVGTSVQDVLRQRAGVCQDFAHLAIACLRRVGLPARYVSGYLLTEPPPGQPRLVGADASHAWFAVCVPGNDGAARWVDFDPTNGCRADARYVTLGWGRDFGDVSPVRGVILGGGEHTLSVEVTVTPLDEAQRQEAEEEQDEDRHCHR